MGLRFEYVFAVKAPADRVWSYLSDPYRVAPALPGAAVTEKVDDRTYKGTITVKVGPVSAKYRGTARFESLDPAARSMEMVGSAQDASGRGGADLKMSSRLLERSAGETEVSVVSEVNITGILAQFGRGMIQDVSNQMFERFTETVRGELEQAQGPAEAPVAATPPAPPPPIEVVSFGSQVMMRAVGRLLRRPVFWLAVAVAAALLWWTLSR
jgi:carbon monoxide dehydrogenase subunit G